MRRSRLKLKQSPAPAIRNRRGEASIEISATEAKNRFGDLLDSVLQCGMALITRHEAPKAVQLSMEEYSALSSAAETKLDSLSGEFDALLARMQTAKARAGMKAAFGTSPEQLGKRLAEGLEGIWQGRAQGPFQSVPALLRSLHRAKKNKKTRRGRVPARS